MPVGWTFSKKCTWDIGRLTLKCDGKISYISNLISFKDIATRGFYNSDMCQMFDKSLLPIFTAVHLIAERIKSLSWKNKLTSCVKSNSFDCFGWHLHVFWQCVIAIMIKHLTGFESDIQITIVFAMQIACIGLSVMDRRVGRLRKWRIITKSPDRMHCLQSLGHGTGTAFQSWKDWEWCSNHKPSVMD